MVSLPVAPYRPSLPHVLILLLLPAHASLPSLFNPFLTGVHLLEERQGPFCIPTAPLFLSEAPGWTTTGLPSENRLKLPLFQQPRKGEGAERCCHLR